MFLRNDIALWRCGWAARQCWRKPVGMFLAGIVLGLMLLALFSGDLIFWTLLNPGKLPPQTMKMNFGERPRASRELMGK